MTARRGYTLIELMIALVIAGVIGAALTRLVINQARFVSSQDGITQARAGARAALNVLTFELRQVTDSGLLRASRDSIDVRVPYAFGIVCDQISGRTIAALLPPDSASYAAAAISGYAWRDSTGAFSFVEPATFQALGSNAPCWGASPPIAVLASPSGQYRSFAVAPNVVATPNGALLYAYQRIRYAFAPSTELPGRRALWRTVLSTGVREELVAPFDTSAAFEFLVGNASTPQPTPPANLSTVGGLRLRLVTASEHAPQGRSAPVTFNMVSDFLFRNNVQ